MHVCMSEFCMKSSWALAVDSELQAPGSLILAESSEGIGGTNAKARELGASTGERRIKRILFLWDTTIAAGPMLEASAKRDALQNRSQGYVRGELD